MTARALAAILAAHEDTVRAVDAALARSERLPDLDSLRVRLRRRLDELHAALSPPLSPELAVEVLVPLVFFLDEHVQHGLATRSQPEAPTGPRWPPLQRDLFPEGDGDGGDVFFERAAELASAATPEPLVLQAYLVCLSAGFSGRHFDEPDVLQAIRLRLADRLPKPTATCEPAPIRQPIPVLRPSWSYWLLGAAALVVAQFVLSIVAWVL